MGKTERVFNIKLTPEETQEITQQIIDWFPRLAPRGAFKLTSPETENYNCIAWAAHDLNRCWWPSSQPRYYWPNDFPLVETIENFVVTFGAQNFQVCEHPNLEHGYEKVALYAKDGRPTHMARMLPNGRWTSKLGDMWDIEHKALDGLEDSDYGQVASLLKRPIPEIEENTVPGLAITHLPRPK